MKNPSFVLSAIGASITLLAAAPSFAADYDLSKPSTSSVVPQVPDGQRSTYQQGKAPLATSSDTTRAEVKSETAAAKLNNAALQAGERSTPDQAKGFTPTPSDTTRAAVRSEAAAANRNGTALPAGERIGPSAADMRVATKAKSHKRMHKHARSHTDTQLPAGEASTPKQAKGATQ